MSYTSGILKHTQIRKFIMMQGEREKTSPKIEKSMSEPVLSPPLNFASIC